jgi:hypothetical protein
MKLINEPKPTSNLNGLRWRDNPTGFVPLPHYFLVKILPSLSDTELRVLLIILSRTVGWKQKDTCPARVRLSRVALSIATGRSNTSVSQAIEGLSSKGLIAIENAMGLPLLTAHTRQKSPALYYRPNLSLIGYFEAFSVEKSI